MAKKEEKLSVAAPVQDKTVEQKLIDLRTLQEAYTKIDQIQTLRGDLPLEVRDLEDEIAGMQTRQQRFEVEVKEGNQAVASEKAKIAHFQSLIERYKGQQEQVRNNREYDNLSKEIEFCELEIQLSEKKINEGNARQTERKKNLTAIKTAIVERNQDLEAKRAELEQAKEETRVEEEQIYAEIKALEPQIEERLLRAFHRIRKGARNGLAVVSVERDACAGCFNKIPPQRQLDVRLHKKVIVCEYCGRIMIDPMLGQELED